MQADDPLELGEDLRRERQRLGRLVASLPELRPRIRSGGEAVEAAALRLHSLYTGVERALHLVRNLYADELRPEPITLLLDDLLPLWQDLDVDLETFEAWAEQVARGADR
jgi:hypothetical protein